MMHSSKRQAIFALLILSLMSFTLSVVGATDSLITDNNEPAMLSTLDVAPGATFEFVFDVTFSEVASSTYADPPLYKMDVSCGIETGFTYTGFTADLDGVDVSGGFTEDITYDVATPISVQLTNADLGPGTATLHIQFTAPGTEVSDIAHDGAIGHIADYGAESGGWGPVFVSVVGTRGVDVSTVPTEDIIPSDGVTTYAVTVENTGNVEDTYDLSISGTGYTSDLVTPQTIASGDTYSYTLTYTDPSSSAGTNAVGTATATSQTDGSATDTATVTTHIVNYAAGLSAAPSTTQTMPNSGTRTYTMTITNTGDVADTFDWTLTGAGYSVVGGNSGTTASLPPGGTEDIIVTYTASGLGTFIGNFDIVSNGSLDAEADDRTDLDLTTNVVDYSVDVTVDKTEDWTHEGGSITYIYTITNNGGEVDSYDWTLTGTGYTTAGGTSGTVGPLALGGGSTTITVTFTDAVGIGDYIGNLEAISSSQGASVSDNLDVTSHVVNYDVTVTTPTDEKWMPNTGTATYTVTITNTGDVADTFDWTLTGAGYSTAGGTSGTTASLAPAGTEDVTVIYTPSGLGTFTGNLEAESNSDSSDVDDITLTTHVIEYDVSQSTPTPTRTMSINDPPETFTVTLTNSGDGPDTYDITIAGAGYSIVGGPFTTATIPIGGTTTYDVQYTASGVEGLYAGTVTATSNSDGAVTHDLGLSVQEWDYQLNAPAGPINDFALDGVGKSYPLTWTNPGNVAVDVDFTYTGVGTINPTSGTISAGGTLDLTLTYPGLTTAQDPAAETITGTVQQDTSVDDSVTVDHDVRSYTFDFAKDFSGRLFAEEGGAVSHQLTFTHTGTHTGQYTVQSTIGDPSTTTFTPGIGGTVALTHDLDATDLVTAGTYTGTITVTSDDDPRKTVTLETSTWVTTPANHETETGVGTGVYDHSATLGLTLDLTTTGTHNLDLWKLSENPDDREPDEESVYYGGFVVNDPTGVTAFQVTVDLPQNILGDADVNTLDVYLLSPAGDWAPAPSGDFNYDGAVDQADFSILLSDWQAYGSEYVVFAIAGEEEFIPIITPPAPTEPPTQEEFDDLDPEDAAETIENLNDDEAAELINGTSTEKASQTLENIDPEKAAKVLEKTDTKKAAEILEQTDKDKAAEIIEKTDSKKAAEIIEETDDDAAAAIINGTSTRKARQVLTNTTSAKAATVMNKTSTAKVKDIVEDAVQSNTTDKVSTILVETDKKKVAEVLLESETGTSAKVIKEMGKVNLNSAAERVEEAVKKKLGELNEETKAKYEQKLKETIENPLLTADDLADLFTEIANLPNTPSTVAEIFEIIEVSRTVEVVDAMIVKDKLSEIGLVFSYLTPEKLVEIYTAMTTAAREAVYPYFDAETMGNLPELTTFSVSADISDTTVISGASVTITADVENTGDEVGGIEVILKVNDVETETETVVLGAGETTSVTWTVTETTPGTYTVDINGETATFTVEAAPEPAAFETSGLTVNPASVQAGEDVTVTVTVENTGEESGSYTVEVELDGSMVDSESVTLDGGASTTTSFTVSSETEGSHTVTVDDLSESFTVEAPTAGFPWTTAIIAIIVIAAVAGYLYMQQQKPEE